MVLYHPHTVQVLDAHVPAPVCVVLGGLEGEIPSLASDLAMLLGNRTVRLAAAMAALGAATDRPLGTGQTCLARR
jgi:hypothetical protein